MNLPKYPKFLPLGLRSYAIRMVVATKFPSVDFGDRIEMNLRKLDTYRFGRNVQVGNGCIIGAYAQIGDNSSIGSGDWIYSCEENAGITIGKNCRLSKNVSIITAKFRPGQPDAFEPITIGDNVKIGVNSTVLNGVEIGDNATIGAGAIVTKDVPDGATVAGIPAKVIGTARANQPER
jgi:acetyltransferase-like isoleucine patch superfamily enzyme